MTLRPPIGTVLVVVPAHDEEQRIGACLTSLAAAVDALVLAHPGVVVATTVVLDACTDRTAARAAQTAAVTGRPVSLVPVDHRCVGAARRAGIEVAVSELSGSGQAHPESVLLVNTDADSIVPRDWLVEHVRLATDGDLVLGEVEPDADLPPAALARWWDLHPRGVGGLHGANLSVRLDVYRRAGGFRPVPAHEDRQLVRDVRALGARVVGGTRVTTSGRLDGRAPQGFAAYLARLVRETDDLTAELTG